MKKILAILILTMVVIFAILFFIERSEAPEVAAPIDIPTGQDQAPGSTPDQSTEEPRDYTVLSEVNQVPITFVSPNLREPLDECIFDIQGRVTGAWFFEGDFPVEIYTADGEFLNTEIARTSDDWMTTDEVDFGVQINCLQASCPVDTKLRFVRDNPSDLRENDDFAEVDIAVPDSCRG